MNLIEVTFTGSDREHAQGAIERHELSHREIEPRVWLIAVSEGTADQWAKRLTAVLPPNAGSFSGRPATDGQMEKVRRGEIVLQR